MRSRRPQAVTAVLVASAIIVLIAGCAPVGHPQSGEAPSPAPTSVFSCPSIPHAPTADPPAVSDVATDDVLAYTSQSAMTEDDFWTIVRTLPSPASDDDFDALSERLRPCGLATWVAFDARLTVLLYRLDTAKLCLWYSINGGFPGPVYSDDFLYARADTVLAGESTYRDALMKGELRWGPSDQGLGEDLLYVGQTAADSVGKADALGAAEERQIPLSYESGTNPASASPGDIQTACIPPS